MIMRSGVFGDPTPATADKGRRWLEIGGQKSAEQGLAYLARHNLYKAKAAP